MKAKNLILVTLLLFSSLTAFCLSSSDSEESRRNITQNYKTDNQNFRVNVDNKYGNITIVEWDKPEIDFSVEIIGKGDKLKIAEAMADRVSIDFKQNNDQIYAKTVFDPIANRCSNCGTTINYLIRVPNTVGFNLTIKYGNINMDIAELAHDFKADVKYGNITAIHLKGYNNITLKYGNITLQTANQLRLDMGYSNCIAEKVEDFSLNSSYSNVHASYIGRLHLNSKYDKLNIGTIQDATISAAYTNFDITQLLKSIYVPEIKYGKFRIADVSPNFEKINISASYTPIVISGFSDKKKPDCYLDLYAHYGNITTSMTLYGATEWKEESSQRLKASIGKNPHAQITIKTTYANIKLEN